MMHDAEIEPLRHQRPKRPPGLPAHLKLPKRSAYYYSDGMWNAIQLLSTPEAYLEAHQMIDHYEAEYNKARRAVGGVSAAHSFQRNVDKLVEKEILERPDTKVSCGLGCTFCCYTEVLVTDDEAALLHAYMKEEGLEIDSDKLRRQGRCTERGQWGEMSYPDRACVFLGPLGQCLVYEHRPLACRKLYSVDPREACDTRTNPGGQVKRPFSPHSEAATSAVYNARPSGFLAEMLLKLLNMGGENESDRKT